MFMITRSVIAITQVITFDRMISVYLTNSTAIYNWVFHNIPFLLITKNQTVSDTAFLLGYKSNSQFFKAFRQWFDCTPSQFKQQH